MARGGFWPPGQQWRRAVCCPFSLSIVESWADSPLVTEDTAWTCTNHFSGLGGSLLSSFEKRDCLTWLWPCTLQKKKKKKKNTDTIVLMDIFSSWSSVSQQLQYWHIWGRQFFVVRGRSAYWIKSSSLPDPYPLDASDNPRVWSSDHLQILPNVPSGATVLALRTTVLDVSYKNLCNDHGWLSLTCAR